MRISSQQLLSASIRAIQDQSVDAMKWQEQISSGQRYNAASQGMVALARGVEIAFDQSKFKMLQANQDFVANRMAMADTQLASMLGSMNLIKEAALQARNGSYGSPAFSSLAQKARVEYEALRQQAAAANASDENILLSARTPARLSQPQVTITNGGTSAVTAATIASDAVFEVGREYSINFESSTEALLQIDGLGPDGTATSFFEGTVSGGVLRFPQQEGQFFNLDVTLTGAPTEGTELVFLANPVDVEVDGVSKIFVPGDYEIAFTLAGGAISSATLSKDGVDLKTVTASGGAITTDSQVGLTTLDFGDDSVNDPPYFYDLQILVQGDVADMSSNDSASFVVSSAVKQIEIEPDVWVDEGISFRRALGDGTSSSKDVLAEALAIVEALESAASSGSLASNFGALMNAHDDATRQLENAQIRSGLLGAQIDAARSALETKSTELEAHRSRLLDTDIAEASAGLVRTQTLLEAARAIFARLESSNLFQRLM